MKRSILTRVLVATGALCVAAALGWFVPLFHVVSLKQARQQTGEAAFNAAAFAAKCWAEDLPVGRAQAADAKAVVAAVRTDPKAARDQYGRGSAFGTTYYYFLAGEGRVVAADARGVSLAVAEDADAARPDVVIEVGNVFGNAVRDGTGLLDAGAFRNSRDFNDVSSEINRRIEADVIPPLRAKAVVGSTVAFVGCAEVVDEATDLSPLRVVPVSAVVR